MRRARAHRDTDLDGHVGAAHRPPRANRDASPNRDAHAHRHPRARGIAGALYADAAADQGQVSRLVFGTNHGPWAFLNADNFPQYKESGLTLLRFPGGNWGDQNNLDAFQIDMFLMVARLNGAEPLVSARLRGGTPEQAIAVMNYSRQQGQPVRYWSIGNEPSLYAPADPQWDTTHFNQEWRRFAQAMKAADPSILLVGPDTHQFMGEPDIDPKDALGRDWLREFLKANGDLVDVVAVHRYPFPVVMGERPTRDQFFADPPRWDTLVNNLRKTVREETGHDKPIAITEFNSSWSGTMGGETGMDTRQQRALAGGCAGSPDPPHVDILTYFTLQSGPTVGGYGLFDSYNARPSYYTYQMYRNFGDRLVFAASDTPAALDLCRAERGRAHPRPRQPERSGDHAAARARSFRADRPRAGQAVRQRPQGRRHARCNSHRPRRLHRAAPFHHPADDPRQS